MEIIVDTVDRQTQKAVFIIGNRTRTYFIDKFGKLRWDDESYSRHLQKLPPKVKGRALAQAIAILQPKKIKKPA